MTSRTKERIIYILIGTIGLIVGGWLCLLSVFMFGYFESGDWVGMVATVVVGMIGAVLCIACGGMAVWMIEEERSERNCGR